MRYVFIILIIFILINIYSSYRRFNGNWKTTEDFVACSGTDIYMNLNVSAVKNNARLIFINEENQVKIMDGSLIFWTLDPRSLFGLPSKGIVHSKFSEAPFPTKMYYKLDGNKLTIYDKKIYGEFLKI